MNASHLMDPSPYESGMWGTAEKPCPSERTLAAHVDGQLDAPRAEAVESHLDECATCARVVRRVEGLSNLLRTWETGTRVEPPSRLSAAVLRTVAPEAQALRRESMRASTRAFALAAAVVVAIGAGVAAALMTVAGAPREGVVRTLAAEPVVSAPGVVAASLDFRSTSLAAVTRTRFDVSPEVAAAAAPAGELPPVPDAEATAAFLRFAPYLETQARVEEDVYVVYDRALPRYAAGPYARARRIEAWYEERARRASEPATFDPSSRGLSVLDVLPLPPAAELPAFLAKLPTFVEPASRRGGGFVVRPLPGRGASAGEPADGVEVADLASAVAAQRVVLEPDTSGEATTLTLDVAPTTVPVLIPAGELVAGGAGDRVVTEGLWLPASSAARTVVLACLPVSRGGGSSGRTPIPTGLVAGPELRGLLAYRAERDGVLALVDGQVGDAALDRGEDGRTSLLALYDVTSAEVAVAKALATEFAARFAENTAGFVVSDPNGRFQGLEHTVLRGPSRRALLERLLVGYFIEARTRTSFDTPRPGVVVESALAQLVERAPRLSASASSARLRGGAAAEPAVRDGKARPSAPGVTPVPVAPVPAPVPVAPAPHRLSGEDPRSGLRFEGVPGEPSKPPLVSGLVPGIR